MLGLLAENGSRCVGCRAQPLVECKLAETSPSPCAVLHTVADAKLQGLQ